MKHLKKLSGILALVAFVNVALVSAAETSYIARTINYVSGKVIDTAKDAAKYIFSREGVIDIAAAYCLSMAITITHELGHALTAKMINGSPIDITIGASDEPSSAPLLSIGGIKWVGFKPMKGFAMRRDSDNQFKNLLIVAAGPVFGALSSIGAFGFLEEYTNKGHLAKITALTALVEQTLGSSGLYAAFTIPGSDGYKIRRALQKLYAGR